MGTRCLTVMLDSWGENEEIAVLYRQMDGYPDGHGADLTEFLLGYKIVNGYSPGESEKCANGGSCLAAQIVAHFKDGIGNFYLYPAGTRRVGEQYIYIVKPVVGDGVYLTVQDDRGKTIIGETKVSDSLIALMQEPVLQ